MVGIFLDYEFVYVEIKQHSNGAFLKLFQLGRRKTHLINSWLLPNFLKLRNFCHAQSKIK